MSNETAVADMLLCDNAIFCGRSDEIDVYLEIIMRTRRTLIVRLGPHLPG